MTNKQIKQAFSKLGYVMEWKIGSEGLAWYVRKHGETDSRFAATNSTALEEVLMVTK